MKLTEKRKKMSKPGKIIRDEMDADLQEYGMPQGEIESLLTHWGNKYVIWRKEWINKDKSCKQKS